ncbi:MAG: glutamine amidotransferase, partial [Bryobacteraceae bacterium]
SMRAPMGPNRLKLVREFVRDGGALAMIGGYATFTGRHNAGNYSGTPIEEALPVNCLEKNDDRIETPEGALAQIADHNHPILHGLDWASEPIFNGYNRVTAKPNARVLARIGESNDPLLVVGEFGSGRSLAFTSDIAPHWGAGFQDWPYCGQFLDQMVLWLARADSA